MTHSLNARRSPTARYWVLVSLLISFGVLTGFSIGIPFLLLGLLLLVLAPVRHRPRIFRPAVVGYLTAIATYVLTAPLTCSSRSSDGEPSTTTCTNLIGIDYTGDGSYNPSLRPALLTALVAGTAVGMLTWAAIYLRHRDL